MKALINVKLYDYENFTENAYVIFEEEIIDVGSMDDFSGCAYADDVEEVEDAGGRILLPGLINFHTHMYSAFARGFDFQSNAKSFTEILNQVWWRIDRNLTLDDIEMSASAHCRELIRNGVVGVLDHHASKVILGSTQAIENAIKESGLHGITCFEISDRFDVPSGVLENNEMHSRSGGPIGLHASMTLSDTTLGYISEKLINRAIHVHVSESKDDHFKYRDTPIQRLNKYNLLNKPSLLAHCVHIDEGDAKIIKESGSVVVLSPLSNMNNGVGTFDYSVFEKFKIPLVIGTDGLGADVARSWQMLYYVCMSDPTKAGDMNLETLRTLISDSYSIYERFTGYRLGKFQKGFRFDAFLSDYVWFTPLTSENVFSHIFFGVFNGLDINSLWNGGKRVIENHTLLENHKIPTLFAKKLWLRMEEEDGHKG